MTSPGSESDAKESIELTAAPRPEDNVSGVGSPDHDGATPEGSPEGSPGGPKEGTDELTKLVPEECDGMRFDVVLAQLFSQYSRSRLQQWIRSGAATASGQTRRPRDPVYRTEALEIAPPTFPHAHVEPRRDSSGDSKGDPKGDSKGDSGKHSSGDRNLVEPNDEGSPNLPWVPEAISLDVVYEDEHVLVVNKPAGLVVHPGAGNPGGTLVNALVHYDHALQALPRAGVIHRLDKDTTGLMVIARTLPAHTALVRALSRRDIEREYVACVAGRVTAGGHVEAPIGRHPTRRVQMAVVQSGREAVTHYRILERFRVHTLLHLKLESGRTHQIRVHMLHLGFPLVGDPLYGGRGRAIRGAGPEMSAVLQDFKRQALHAERLGFAHPETGDWIEVTAPRPDDFQTLLSTLRDDRAAHDGR